MPLPYVDRAISYRTLRTLSASIRDARKELTEPCSDETRQALEAWIDQMTETAIAWIERSQGDVPAQIMQSGSAELVEHMPLAGKDPVQLQAAEIETLVKNSPPEYIDLCISRGMPTKTLPLAIIDRLEKMPKSQRGPWEAMLERPEMNASVACNSNGQSAWQRMDDYQKSPVRKLAFLRKQIAAFPEYFEEVANRFSKESRKCGPLLVLVLSGVRLTNATPPNSDDISARRMRFLCSKITSNHGLMQLRVEFGPLEETLPDMQSLLDSWFRTNGIHG